MKDNTPQEPYETVSPTFNELKKNVDNMTGKNLEYVIYELCVIIDKMREDLKNE